MPKSLRRSTPIEEFGGYGRVPAATTLQHAGWSFEFDRGEEGDQFKTTS